MSFIPEECSKIVYNNIDLGELLKVHIDQEPVYNKDQTTIKYHNHRIRVESIIPGDFTADDIFFDAPATLSEPEKTMAESITDIDDYTDDSMEAVRKFLNMPRKNLFLALGGYSPIIVRDPQKPLKAVNTYLQSINTSLTKSKSTIEIDEDNTSTYLDPNFGPKPRVVSWEPAPGRGVARVVWEVEVALVDCIWDVAASSGYSPPSVLGKVNNIHYEIDYSYNDMGECDRTIKGEVSINNTVTGGQFYTHVDNIRDTLLIAFPAPPNFRRNRQRFQVSSDRSTLTFTIGDEEISSPSPFPQDVIDIDITHDIESDGPAFVVWDNTFSGEISIAPGVPAFRAWAIYSSLLIARLSKAIQVKKTKHKKRKADGNAQMVDIPIVPLVKSVKLRERLYRRRQRFSFSFSWHQVVSKPIEIFKRSGMFTPIHTQTGDTWLAWKNSVPDTYDPRGTADLRDSMLTTVVDPCMSTSESLVASRRHYTSKIVQDDTVTLNFNIFAQTCPEDVKNTWVLYKNKAFLIAKGTTELIKKYPDETYKPGTPPEDSTDDGTAGHGYDRDRIFPEKLGKDFEVVDKGYPTPMLVIVGTAIRIGSKTKPPIIRKFGGANVVLFDQHVENEVIRYGGCPAYRTTWKIEYIIKGEPVGDDIEGLHLVFPME